MIYPIEKYRTSLSTLPIPVKHLALKAGISEKALGDICDKYPLTIKDLQYVIGIKKTYKTNIQTIDKLLARGLTPQSIDSLMLVREDLELDGPPTLNRLLNFYEFFNGGDEVDEDTLHRQIEIVESAFNESGFWRRNKSYWRGNWDLSTMLKLTMRFAKESGRKHLETALDFIRGPEEFWMDGMDIESSDYLDYMENLHDNSPGE